MIVSVRRGELAVGVALLLIAAFALWEAWRMPPGTLGAPGPGFFPGVLGALLGVAGIGLAFRAVRAGAEGAASVSMGHRHIALTTAALVALSLAFEWLGYVIAASLFLLVLLRAFSRLGWLRSLVFAVVSALASYALFTRALGVALPTGLLHFG